MDRNETKRLLVIKTGALGDVLRCTSILEGLERLHGPELQVTWLTARGARPLLAGLAERGDVTELLTTAGEGDLGALGSELLTRGFDRILSLDDEEPLCALATRLAAGATDRITGAYLDGDGARVYSDDAAPWFDMGLLSRHGKARADELKILNRRTYPDLMAEVVGAPFEPGQDPDPPRLVLPDEALARGRERLAALGSGPRIGLNTGAGGRWTSKALPEERVVALAQALAARPDAPSLVLLGGPDEVERNARLAQAITTAGASLYDAGTDNDLISFSALVGGLDMLISSDSLALHMAIAQQVPVVAFFAPTSAAEIELYGRGAKVASTAPDACSYRPDADNSTVTVERLLDAIARVLPV